MALPLMVRAMRLSIEAVDRRLEERGAHAGRRAVAGVPRRSPCRSACPAMLAGAVLGFARSIGEFGATITFVSNIPGETRTLPLAIYSRAADARRRARGDAAGADLGGAVAGGADRLGTARAARGDGGCMSFDIDVDQAARRGGDRARRSSAGDGADGAVRPVGRRARPACSTWSRGCCGPIAGISASMARRCSMPRRGIDLPPERRRVGYVFQDPRLFPHLRVRANLLYGAPRRRALIGSTRRSPFSASAICSIAGRARCRAARRSAWRSAARCSAIPRFLLMDEPLSSLDRARREEIMRVIEHIRDVAATADPDGHARPRRSRAAGDAGRAALVDQLHRHRGRFAAADAQRGEAALLRRCLQRRRAGSR